MKKKRLLTLLGIVLFLQLFVLLRSAYQQLNPAEVPSLLDGTTESVSEGISNSEPSTKLLSQKEMVSPELVFENNPSSEYYALNPDYVGWISVPNTKVDYPVVRGTDNSFYLSHNFYKEEDKLGSIFMDYRNVGMGLDNHTILYGHYSSYGHMFTELEKFLSEDFLLNNPTFSFNDPYTDKVYEIFSVHIAPADPTFIQTTFKDGELLDYVTFLKNQSIVDLEIEADEDMKIFTLITCNYVTENARLYIHALEKTP